MINDWFGSPSVNRPNVPDIPVTQPLNCKVECKVGEETEMCVFINATVSRPEYRERVFDFHELFSQYSSSGTIPHSAVMTLFDNQDDQCNRGGISLGEGGLFTNASNAGKPCYLGYSSNLIGDVTLGVPPKITGQISEKPADATFDIQFPREDESFELLFSNPSLHKDLGGKLVEINVLKNRIFFRTQSICLASAI